MLKVENYVSVSYSERRGEIYITSIANEPLFTIQETSNYTEEALNDDVLLKEEVMKNFSDVLEDLLSNKPYFKKTINPSESRYCDNLYEVSIPNHSEPYFVFAYNAGEAAERVAGYLVDLDLTGGLYTREEILSDETEDELDNYIFIDCSSYCKKEKDWCRYTPTEGFRIFEFAQK